MLRFQSSSSLHVDGRGLFFQIKLQRGVRNGPPGRVLCICMAKSWKQTHFPWLFIFPHLPPWSWHCSEKKHCCGVEPFLRCFMFTSSQLEATHSNLAEHRTLSFLSSFFLFLHRDSPAEPCDGTPVLDAGHLALGPARRRHLPYNEAFPVPGRSAHLSCGAAHAQLLVSRGVCLCWQQLLDWSRRGSRVICWLGFFSNGKVHKFSPTKWGDDVVCDCTVWLSFFLENL